MSKVCDVLVVGAGPAGMQAAITAAAAGTEVVIVDRAPWEGGNIYRHHGIVRDLQPGPSRPGDSLKRRFRASGVDLRLSTSVIDARADRTLTLSGPKGLERVKPKAVIVACGASERIIPFSGWTQPGVIGLAAMTNMMKADDAVPAGRILLSGLGPLLYSAAYKAHCLGAQIAAVIDPLPRAEWIGALPKMATRPILLGTGAFWMMKLRRAGIPVLNNAFIRQIQTNGLMKHVLVESRGTAQSWRFEVEAVCVGHGLRPNTELTRLIGAEHHFDGKRGGLVPVLSGNSETSVPGFFVTGDCGGILGAEAALRHGSRVGRHVARSIGKNPRLSLVRTAMEELRLLIAISFGGAMAKLASPPFELYEKISGDTVICRCEEVTREEYCGNTGGANTAKMRTRCGMGPCQGRFCGDTASFLLANQGQVSIDEVERWTPRMPIFPTSIGDLMGQFSDEELGSSSSAAAERGLYE